MNSDMYRGKVCIMIPSFNNADSIASTLQSIQAQGEFLAQIECVYLFDDCSGDATVTIAKAAWNAATPFEVVRRETNLGNVRNHNCAMTELNQRADWVLILHADAAYVV